MDVLLTGADRPASCLTATLHHLVLASPDPSRLADYYHRALGYEVSEHDGVLVGQAVDRRLVFVNGPPKTLAGAGFSVADGGELERLRKRIETAGWTHEVGKSPLFGECVSVRDPDGTEFLFGVPLAEPVASGAAAQARAARLQHVVMASRDPDRIAAFFADVIGFTLSDVVVDPQGGVRTSFLRCSQEHHSFAVFKAPENRLDHHCYETTDWNLIRDWCDHMASQDIPIQWGPGRHKPGNNLFIFVHDPDGNWVELSAELEIVDHDRPVGSWPHEERTLNSWGQGLLRS